MNSKRNNYYIDVNPIITKKEDKPVISNIKSKKELEDERKKAHKIEEQNLGIDGLDLFME